MMSTNYLSIKLETKKTSNTETLEGSVQSTLRPKFILDELLPHWIRCSELSPKVTITIWTKVAPLPPIVIHHALPSAMIAWRWPTVSTTPTTEQVLHQWIILVIHENTMSFRRRFKGHGFRFSRRHLDVCHCDTGLAKRESITL